MKKLITILIVVFACVVPVLSQSQDMIIILKDNTILRGKIVAETQTSIVLEKATGEVIVINNEDISSITPVVTQSVESEKQLGQEEIGENYIKIPLFVTHRPSTKIGLIITQTTFKPDGFSNIYGDDNATSIGFTFEADYSPIVAFTLKYFGASSENNDIDSLGWITGDTLEYSYDLKWSQQTFYIGPRFHYQYSLLCAYFDAGVSYTTLREKGKYFEIPGVEQEYSRGLSAFGFGYGFGIQLITPYSMCAFFEYSVNNAEIKNINIGNKYIGGGFQFVIPYD